MNFKSYEIVQSQMQIGEELGWTKASHRASSSSTGERMRLICLNPRKSVAQFDKSRLDT